jgi:hypothetical protein
MMPMTQAHTAFAPAQLSGATHSAPPPKQQQGGWDQAGLIAALNQMSLQGSAPWVLDTSATSHTSSSDGILQSRLPLLLLALLLATAVPSQSHVVATPLCPLPLPPFALLMS